MKANKDQSVFDISVQEFGNLEELFTLLDDNNLTLNTKLTSGQDLLINKTGEGDENVKDFISLNNLTLNNNQGISVPPIFGGDYSIDYSIDYS